MMDKIDLFKAAKKQPQSLEDLQHALGKYQGLQSYLEATEEDMTSEWWPLEAIQLLPFDPLGANVNLPSFGGDKPEISIYRVLSWDTGRLLIAEEEEMRLTDR